ncbi:MFS transporter [Bradyrhizobium liaoningense]|uniref:MFS transporter n=1 Tax=Bradyrhizobium liaoningense TaxID=43992 RepID=UPI001BAE3035|nr:MFS transporter [Bradyrhizobium liaoningense]MBR0840434.1 MFS transporter [Bradyrhizobium liaoningense]
MKDRNWGIVVVYAVLMCISMALPIFGGSVVNTAMARAFGWDSTSLGLLVAANMATMAFLLPFAAKTTQALGVRVSMIIGFGAMGVGAMALSLFVTRPEQAIVAYGVAMGITSAFSGVVPCQIGVVAWFPNRKTLALSVLYALVGTLAFALIALISGGIARTGDWRFGWYVFEAAAALAVLLLLAFVRNPNGDASRAGGLPPGELEPKPEGFAAYPGMSFRQAAAMPLFWTIVLSMIVITSGSVFLAAHAQVFLLDRGYAPPLAASSMSVMQIGMVVGNLGLGFLAPRIELRRAMALALVACAIAFALLSHVSGAAPLIAFAVAAGVGYGAGQVGSMALVAHYWGQKVFPMLTATALILQTVVSAFIPIVAGAYYDTHGSYLPPIYAMMGANLLIACAILIAGREPTARLAPAE